MTSRVANFFINGFGSLKIRSTQDVKNLYQGNIRLVYAYWILGGIVLGIFDLALRGVEHYMEISTNENTINALLIIGAILLFIFIPLFIFSCIVTWRSANKYEGRKLWRRLAKFSIAFSIFIYAFGFVANYTSGVIEETKKQMIAQANNNWSAPAVHNPDLI